MKGINRSRGFAFYIYRVWILASLVIPFFLAYVYYPITFGKEDLLHADVHMMIFLPSYFTFIFLWIHLFHRLVGNHVLSNLISGFFLSITFVYSLTYMDYPIITRIAASFYGLVIGLAHYIFTLYFYRRHIFYDITQNK